ncbi:MAG: peptidylprolyl isomerase [Nitrospira sp.]|nr:peptidylprolyl isomerase [Nitrospira sp.]
MQDTNKKRRRWLFWTLFGLGGIVLLTGAGLYASGVWEIGRPPYGLKLPKVVAKVGEDPISRDLVYQRMRQHEAMRPEGFKDKDSNAMKLLAAQVVDQLIQQRIVFREAGRLGVGVTQSEVEQQYAKTQANFGSQEEFEKKLREGNTDPQTLRRDIRDFILSQKVDFSLQQQISVSDREITDFFEKNKQQLLQDRLRARHILVENLAQAQEALHLLKQGGKEFAEVARLYSKDQGTKEQGGELGWFTKGQLVPEFEEAAFSLRPGEVSRPVQTQFGYHIIQLEEIQSARHQTLTDHREHISNILRSQKWQAQKQAWLNQLYQQTSTWKAPEVSS